MRPGPAPRAGVPGTCRKLCSLLLGCDGVALVQQLMAVAQVLCAPGHDAKLSTKQLPSVRAYSFAVFALLRVVFFFCTPRALVLNIVHTSVSEQALSATTYKPKPNIFTIGQYARGSMTVAETRSGEALRNGV